MNSYFPLRSCLVAVVLAVSFLAAGCASTQPKAALPKQAEKIQLKNVPGILILNGETMIQQITDEKTSAIMFTASMNYSERLDYAFEKRGIPTQRYVFRDKEKTAGLGVTARLLKEKKRDSVIQITVYLRKDGNKLQMVLEPIYNPLVYSDDGSAVTAAQGISEKLIVYDSTDYRMAHNSLTKFAESFADKVVNKYYKKTSKIFTE